MFTHIPRLLPVINMMLVMFRLLRLLCDSIVLLPLKVVLSFILTFLTSLLWLCQVMMARRQEPPQRPCFWARDRLGLGTWVFRLGFLGFRFVVSG